MLGDCETPKLDAVEELPRVDVLDTFLGQVVSDVSNMQAELSNVQEPKLVRSG